MWMAVSSAHEFYQHTSEPFSNSKSPTFKPMQITIFQALISIISWNDTNLSPNTDSPCKFLLSATTTVFTPFFTLNFVLYPKVLPVSSLRNCGHTAPVFYFDFAMLWNSEKEARIIVEEYQKIEQPNSWKRNEKMEMRLQIHNRRSNRFLVLYEKLRMKKKRVRGD